MLDPDGRVEWVQSDLREWDPASLGQAPDVVVTSSTLQWVPGHLDLLDAWVGALADGGWFALQVPGNFDAPSHRLMRETAEHHERAGELDGRARPARRGGARDLPALPQPAGLRRSTRGRRPTCTCSTPTARTRTRCSPGWRATGLRPVIEILTDDDELAAFIDPYAAALADAYPRSSAGVLFPFRRVFAVAQKVSAAG